METTVICTVQVTRVIRGACGVDYPKKIFARHIAEAIKEECNPDDILIDSVQVFENEAGNSVFYEVDKNA